jgi:UDP-2,4-diacetamido-2,4,6-trideoxy-beta-L-altropyranose hydrolase
VLKLSGEMLLIRADASVAIGTGHVMRCLAISQAWKEAGGAVTFVMSESAAAMEERLRSQGFALAQLDAKSGSGLDAERLVALARSHDPAWVVVDGYDFGADYQRALKRAQLKILFIDDNGGLETYAADFVLNHNLHARESLYNNREIDTQLLLGTKYALLRREFVSASARSDPSPVACKLLVTMGGSDPTNVTLRVMEAIEQVEIENLEVMVVTGGSNPHFASVAECVAQSNQHCRVLSNVANMQPVISWADLAISAAGGACWEFCALGLPSILLAVADNQLPNAEMTRLITRVANSLSEREALSHTARSLVDGKGAARVVSALLGPGNS